MDIVEVLHTLLVGESRIDLSAALDRITYFLSIQSEGMACAGYVLW